jgi:hypothetical protein
MTTRDIVRLIMLIVAFAFVIVAASYHTGPLANAFGIVAIILFVAHYILRTK